MTIIPYRRKRKLTPLRVLHADHGQFGFRYLQLCAQLSDIRVFSESVVLFVQLRILLILCTQLSPHLVCGLPQLLYGRLMLVDQRVHLAQLCLQLCHCGALAWGFFLPGPVLVPVVAVRILLRDFKVHI